jgi:hypothetical protein
VRKFKFVVVNISRPACRLPVFAAGAPVVVDAPEAALL